MIDDGGPAFPTDTGILIDGVPVTRELHGMSLRDWFAGHAPEVPEWFVCDWVRDHPGSQREQEAAMYFAWPWVYADRMLAERKREETTDESHNRTD